MTKKEFVHHVWTGLNSRATEGIDKIAVEHIIDRTFDGIQDALRDEGRFTRTGFGTFEVREHDARTGRDPRTGKPLEIPARKVVAFKNGNVLRKDLATFKGAYPTSA